MAREWRRLVSDKSLIDGSGGGLESPDVEKHRTRFHIMHFYSGYACYAFLMSTSSTSGGGFVPFVEEH